MSAILEVISEADAAKLYQAKHLTILLADLTSHCTPATTINTESFCVVLGILNEKLEFDTQPLKSAN